MKSVSILNFILIVAATSAIAEPVTIHCPTEPPVVRRLQLQERWRIDGDDPEAPILGYFRESQVFVHDGRVYMLDPQLCNVLVYSDEGAYLDTILREGDGPGEVRRPGAMFLCSADRIAVRHGHPSRLEIVDLDGTPRGGWRLQGSSYAFRIQESDSGWFVVYTESKASDDPEIVYNVLHVGIHNDEGEQTFEYYRHSREVRIREAKARDELAEYNPWNTVVAVSGGQIVRASARDEYRLEWRGLNGDITRVVTREFSAHRRTEAELDDLKFRSYRVSNNDFQFIDRKLSTHDPMIASVEPLADGRLRVRTSLFGKELAVNMVCRFEMHSATGELIERVEIYDPSGDFDTEYDAIALLDDGRAMVLRNVRSASHAAIAPFLHPEILAHMRPIPDERDDIMFTPVMCELVPYVGPMAKSKER